MSTTKFFFTLILLFSFGIITQAQVNTTTPVQEETTVSVEKAGINTVQMEEGMSFPTTTDLNTNSNTETTAAPAGANITLSTLDAYVFYFNYKQFIKPTVRKSGLC